MDEYGRVVEFTDSKGRAIEIEVSDDNNLTVKSYHNGKVVGRLEFAMYLDRNVLAHAEVKAEYQKAGIATRMFRELVGLDDDIFFPNAGWSASTGHEFYLSQEGASLINACIRLGILSAKHEAPY